MGLAIASTNVNNNHYQIYTVLALTTKPISIIPSVMTVLFIQWDVHFLANLYMKVFSDYPRYPKIMNVFCLDETLTPYDVTKLGLLHLPTLLDQTSLTIVSMGSFAEGMNIIWCAASSAGLIYSWDSV